MNLSAVYIKLQRFYFPTRIIFQTPEQTEYSKRRKKKPRSHLSINENSGWKMRDRQVKFLIRSSGSVDSAIFLFLLQHPCNKMKKKRRNSPCHQSSSSTRTCCRFRFGFFFLYFPFIFLFSSHLIPFKWLTVYGLYRCVCALAFYVSFNFNFIDKHTETKIIYTIFEKNIVSITYGYTRTMTLAAFLVIASHFPLYTTVIGVNFSSTCETFCEKRMVMHILYVCQNWLMPEHLLHKINSFRFLVYYVCIMAFDVYNPRERKRAPGRRETEQKWKRFEDVLGIWIPKAGNNVYSALPYSGSVFVCVQCSCSRHGWNDWNRLLCAQTGKANREKIHDTQF